MIGGGPIFSQSPHTWNCFPSATLTDAIYWAAQPPAVQALQGGSNLTLAVQLATQGYVIDNAIMVWGWDPVCTMGERAQAGDTWVPSLLQANVLPPTTGPVPPGAIKVSTDAADYPPYTPPTPPSTSLIGTCYPAGALGTVCALGPGAGTVVNGQILVQNGVSYTAHVTPTPFGPSIYLTQN